MRQRLSRRFDQSITDQIITQLQDKKLLDDAKLSEQFVHSRLQVRHQGRFRISQELFKRGVARELANEAVATVSDADERVSASELLARRLKTWQNLAPLQQRQRAIGLLSRRGFAAKVIRQVIDELILGRSEIA